MDQHISAHMLFCGKEKSKEACMTGLLGSHVICSAMVQLDRALLSSHSYICDDLAAS